MSRCFRCESQTGSKTRECICVCVDDDYAGSDVPETEGPSATVHFVLFGVGLALVAAHGLGAREWLGTVGAGIAFLTMCSAQWFGFRRSAEDGTRAEGIALLALGFGGFAVLGPLLQAVVT